jgi:hypothetical protein
MNNLHSRNDHFLDWDRSRTDFTEGSPFGISRRKSKYDMKTEAEEKEIKEENRKIRYLRFLVDFSILSIQQDDLLLEEAEGIVENVKRAACSLFPGKEETFELIYRPRFNRVIRERFGFSRESGGSESI